MNDLDSLFKKGEDAFRAGIDKGKVVGRGLGTIFGVISSVIGLSYFHASPTTDASFSVVLILVVLLILILWLNLSNLSESAIQSQIEWGTQQLRENGFWLSFTNGFGIMFSLTSLLSVWIYRGHLITGLGSFLFFTGLYITLIIFSIYFMYKYPKSN